MKKLKEPEHALDRFLPVVAKLGRKLGPVLFQLPPGWGRDNERLEQFLQALPIDLRYTFEFRNPEWHHPDIYSILARYNVAFCIFEIAGFHSPVEVTASFVYVRLHGPDQHAYSGDYPLDTLRVWAERLKSWRRKGVTAYLYFDNDQNAFAPRNALELKQLVNSSADCPP